MLNRLFKILIFFRIVDFHDNLLSITNIVMYICLFRLVNAPQASYNEIGGLLVSMAAYSYKKYLNNNQGQ